MTRRISLATIKTYATLIDGRVAIKRLDGEVRLYKPFSGVEISDNFDAYRYELVLTNKYSGIGYAGSKTVKAAQKLLAIQQDRVRFLVAQKLGIYPGCSVHLYSNEGVYKIVSHTKYSIEVSCNRWSLSRVYPLSNLKCLAGGLHNFNKTLTK
jgi:hypothetical protein